MSNLLLSILFFLTSFASTFNARAKDSLSVSAGDFSATFQIKFKPETFTAKNSNLLNNANLSDWLFFNRGTIDVSSLLDYDHGTIQFFATIRNKANWGDPETIAQSTDSEVKLLDAVFGAHRHFITRHVTWIREIWLKFNLNTTLGLSFNNNHYFTLGAFPFELGRGISYGANAAVNPRFLGFYSDNSIDQYTYAFKLSGYIVAKILGYDLYGGIIENKTDTFTNTSLRILGQQFGRRVNPERGAGKINFVVASRLKWNPLSRDGMNMIFEPYALFNHAPEQAIEFPADSSSKLGTFGCAGEFVFGNFEWGFDGAINVGRQQVKGWDRNKIEFENRGGAAFLVNSRVVTQNPLTTPKPTKALFDPNSTAGKQVQAIINTTTQNASQNGKEIGQVGPVTLYNDLNRFRNPHNNTFQGWMFVADAAYWLKKPMVKIATTFGIASGDENPNQNLDNPTEVRFDGNFKGFIGLQELYSGPITRVQSAFFLGGAGRIPRPLSVPNSEEGIDELPSQVTGFTNLVFVGSGLHWYPQNCKRTFTMRPNVLFYWQQHATKKFDILTGMSSPTENARNYLGCEVNTFSDVALTKNLKLFAIASFFVPGSHYTDIKGTPLTKDQLKIIDSIDVTGFDAEALPLLGNNIAYTLNIGLEYRY